MNPLNKKIALIRPDVPADFPLGRMRATVPLGLLVLAGCLREAGCDVVIIDDHLEQRGAAWVAAQVRDWQADVIGLSINLATVPTAALIFAQLTALDIPVVVGGPEVTAGCNQVLQQIPAPFAVRGEGEETLVALLRELAGERRFESVAGLTFRDERTGNYVSNDRRPWIAMDSVPLLPYDLLELERYDRSYAEFGADRVEVLNTSRGCPFKCTFCSNKHVWSNSYRAMSPQRMIEQVRHAVTATDATAIYFREDHFTLDVKRVMEFCSLVRSEGLNFEWGCESRVNNLTPELVQAMAAAGLSSMWFGVESGSDDVLRRLNKGTTVAEVRTAVELCRAAGVKVGFSVMLGLPGETRAELQQTIDLVFELKPDWVYWAAFVGLPGAELYEVLESHPELIFCRWQQLILPHNEIMTYPEKLRLKQQLELRFNLQPRILWGHLRRMGVRRFARKAGHNLGRLLRTRFNRHNTEGDR
ncbi:MAG: B12-binding domain-containing radical SAM protein [Desulfuromonadaceae bacterium]|nr:B12-binding domain-containing radical SAM protein [Desulfuromonadaceae bacterium]